MLKSLCSSILVCIAICACGSRGAVAPNLPVAGRPPLLNQKHGQMMPWQPVSIPLDSPNLYLLAPGRAKTVWYADPSDQHIGFVNLQNLKVLEYSSVFTNGTATAQTPAQMVYDPKLKQTYVTLTGGDGGIGVIQENGTSSLFTLPGGVKPSGGMCLIGGFVYLMGNDGYLYAFYTDLHNFELLEAVSGVSGQVASMAEFTDSSTGHKILVLADEPNKQVVYIDLATLTLSAVATPGYPQAVTVDASKRVFYTQKFGSFGANAGYIGTDRVAHELVDSALGSTYPDAIIPGPSAANYVVYNNGDGYLSLVDLGSLAITDVLETGKPVYISTLNGLALGSDQNVYAAGDTPGNGKSTDPPKIMSYLNCWVQPSATSLTFSATGQNQPLTAIVSNPYCGTLSASSANASIVQVTGSGGSFTATSEGAGSTTIRISDTSGNFVTVNVLVQ